MCSFARAIAQALIDWASKAADDASTAKTMPPTVVSTAVQCRADLSTVVAQSATLAAPFVHVTAPALDDKSLIEHVLRTFADATGDVARYKHADHGRAARKQRKVPGTGRTPSPSALVVDTDGSSVRSGEGGSCASDTPFATEHSLMAGIRALKADLLATECDHEPVWLTLDEVSTGSGNSRPFSLQVIGRRVTRRCCRSPLPVPRSARSPLQRRGSTGHFSFPWHRVCDCAILRAQCRRAVVMARCLGCVVAGLQVTRNGLLDLNAGCLPVPVRRGGVAVVPAPDVIAAFAACAPCCMLLLCGNSVWQADLLARAGVPFVIAARGHTVPLAAAAVVTDRFYSSVHTALTALGDGAADAAKVAVCPPVSCVGTVWFFTRLRRWSVCLCCCAPLSILPRPPCSNQLAAALPNIIRTAFVEATKSTFVKDCGFVLVSPSGSSLSSSPLHRTPVSTSPSTKAPVLYAALSHAVPTADTPVPCRFVAVSDVAYVARGRQLLAPAAALAAVLALPHLRASGSVDVDALRPHVDGGVCSVEVTPEVAQGVDGVPRRSSARPSDGSVAVTFVVAPRGAVAPTSSLWATCRVSGVHSDDGLAVLTLDSVAKVSEQLVAPTFAPTLANSDAPHGFYGTLTLLHTGAGSSNSSSSSGGGATTSSTSPPLATVSAAIAANACAVGDDEVVLWTHCPSRVVAVPTAAVTVVVGHVVTEHVSVVPGVDSGAVAAVVVSEASGERALRACLSAPSYKAHVSGSGSSGGSSTLTASAAAPPLYVQRRKVAAVAAVAVSAVALLAASPRLRAGMRARVADVLLALHAWIAQPAGPA